MEAPDGRAAILAGSCSSATRRQVEIAIRERIPAFRIDPIALASGALTVQNVLDRIAAQNSDKPVLVYSSAAPDEVQDIQNRLGRMHAGEQIERLLADIARALPQQGFTRLIVGDCGGGQGDSSIGFTEGWDMELATEFGRTWYEKGYIAGALLDVEDLVAAIDGVLRLGSSAVVPTLAVLPRVPRPADG